MTGWRLYLAARGTLAFAVLALLTTAVVVRSGVVVFEITLDDTRIPRFTPIWELLPVLLGVAGAALLAPRMASWEYAHRARLRVRAGLLAAAGATLPAVVPWVASLRLPEDARWWDIACNVAFYTAVALIATACAGVVAGPLIGFATYLAVIAIQQTSPALAAHLPVSGAQTNLRAHWVATLLLVALAAGVWAATLGQASHVARRRRND